MSPPGEQLRITALINNTLHWQSIPPGVIEDTPAGKRQRYWHDFFNYAGIHRNVWLCATDPTHITDVTITTDLDGETAVIDYTVDADATDDVETKVILRDTEGTRGHNQHRAKRQLACSRGAQMGTRRRLPLRS